MFYGSGAGKLPTASAVVADVVDCAKHLHRNIMMSWSSKTLSLMKIDDVEGIYFVRVAGTPSEKMEDVRALFGQVDPITIPSVSGEFAFLTGCLSEAQFAEKAAQLPGGILNRIRVHE